MRYGNFINNAFVQPLSKEHYEVINPFDQRVIASAAKSNEDDVNMAVSAAREAFDRGPWGLMLASERAKILWKLAGLVEKYSLALATVESKNQGKTIKYARDSDLPFIVDTLRFFAGAARMLEGKAAAEYSGMGTSFVRREPMGVVAGIVPWNYPLYIAVWKFAPAIAAGNTLILKPASATPLTLLDFAKLTVQAGLPKGVFNIVTGAGETVGAALAEHRDIDMVSFTGDTSTGKKIMERASKHVKKVHLELGGKAPLIVMKDADLEMAAQGAVIGGYWNGGQDCTAVTRVYVHEDQHDALVRLMASRARKFRLGNQLLESTDMGPLISERQVERVESYVQYGARNGANVVCGGKRPKAKHLRKGFFFEPTILTEVEHESKVCKEEIFGPVISVFPYNDVDSAVAKANDVVYGLSASVYGCNVSDCLGVANRLKFGTVWINEHGVLVPEMPHGGFKQSGFGKDLSMYSFDEYTKVKHVYVDLTKLRRRSWHYTVLGKK